jgi:hypothetical protein
MKGDSLIAAKFENAARLKLTFARLIVTMSFMNSILSGVLLY